MSQLTWPGQSPLWRIGLYRCANIAFLQVGEGDALFARKTRIDECVNGAGLSLVRSSIKPDPDSHTDVYSDICLHGYTYHASIGKSGILIHTYPEIGTFTIVVETCDDEEGCEEACRKFGDLLYRHLGAQKMFVTDPTYLPLFYPAEE